MAPRPAHRSEIAPFYVMEVMRAAADVEAAGGEVLHLEVGQPSSPAPELARAAATRAIDTDTLGYTGALGINPLRERIVTHYASWYGVDIDVAQVAVTQGASGAFGLAFMACFDVGARVAVATPGYPAYRNTLTALGIEPVDVPVDAGTRFQPAPEVLEPVLPLDGLIVASPSNPTGTMLAAAEMDALVEWCGSHDVTLISDEIYHGITYEQAAPTAAARTDVAVVVNSFSKYFSMTGWRMGWLVADPSLMGAVERLSQNTVISAPTVSQYAALAAFDATAELEENVARYRRNRTVLLEGLPRIGLDRLAPADGAFYVYADVSSVCADSQELCRRWLSELSIAATPGIDFDPARGHRYVRFSFAGSTDDMTEALARLGPWMAQHG